MKCLIVSGGAKPDLSVIKNYSDKSDLIIGVDKGCNYLHEAKIKPDYIVGDFDSSNLQLIDELVALGTQKYSYKAEKDSTDSELAFQLAFEKKVDDIFFLGATGERFDHTLGNIGLLLKSLDFKVKASIIDDKNKIIAINKSTCFSKDESFKYISFLAYKDEVEDLSISGAKYNLNNYSLKIGDGRTISNEFLENEIRISFSSGTLLVIYSKD